MQKILVIEDEHPLRENLIQMLEFEDFQPLEAEDGHRGIELARQHLPALIICDIAMPEIDGYQVLRTLQDTPETAQIPFIFLTARAGKEEVMRGLASGAVQYVTKPFAFVDLLQIIKDQLTGVE